MAEDRNKFLNESGKAGLILAGVAIAYFLLTTWIGKIEGMGALSMVIGFVLWAGKVALCIWLMVKFLRKFAEENAARKKQTKKYFDILKGLL